VAHTVSGVSIVVWHSLAYLSVQKLLVSDVPLKVFVVQVNHAPVSATVKTSHAGKKRYHATMSMQFKI